MALETRYQMKIGEGHDILPWLAMYAAVLLNICSVGEAGKTAHERRRVKKCKRELVDLEADKKRRYLLLSVVFGIGPRLLARDVHLVGDTLSLRQRCALRYSLLHLNHTCAGVRLRSPGCCNSKSPYILV